MLVGLFCMSLLSFTANTARSMQIAVSLVNCRGGGGGGGVLLMPLRVLKIEF